MKSKCSLAKILAGLLLALELMAANPTCAPLTAEREADLSLYVHRKYRLPEGVQLTVTAVSNIGDTCYRKLHFESASQGGDFDKVLYLTPDERFLAPELNDSAIDPIEEEKNRLAVMRRDLENGEAAAVAGPQDASVSVVVFSDFQCPFCRQFAATLNQTLRDPEAEAHVRVLFRYMPLGMHPWAEIAAESAACVQIQDMRGFWQLHDYLFAHQADLTPENIRQMLDEHIRLMPHVQTDAVLRCIDRKLSLTVLERNRALAKEYGVHATPTVFVNGIRVEGAPTREHLLTLIHEAVRDAALNSK